MTTTTTNPHRLQLEEKLRKAIGRLRRQETLTREAAEEVERINKAVQAYRKQEGRPVARV